MAERHPERARVADDWYVEPSWCVDILLGSFMFLNGLHDPCCGSGTIPKTAQAQGLQASGADLRDRGAGFPVRDFFTDSGPYPAIVTNPPYSSAVKVIEHALEVVVPGGLVCALVQAKFLFSQKRKALFERLEMEQVIILSRRPSMPPGEELAKHGEAIRGGGSIDFCWCVWRAGSANMTATIQWAV